MINTARGFHILILIAAIGVPGLLSEEPNQGISMEFVDSLSGEWISTNDMRGQYIFIHFWSKDCPPCKELMPQIKDLHDNYSGLGVRFIGVNMDDGFMDFWAYCRENGIDWPQYCDPLSGLSNKVATDFGIQGVPALVLLDTERKNISKQAYHETMIQLRELILKITGVNDEEI